MFTPKKYQEYEAYPRKYFKFCKPPKNILTLYINLKKKS